MLKPIFLVSIILIINHTTYGWKKERFYKTYMYINWISDIYCISYLGSQRRRRCSKGRELFYCKFSGGKNL